MSTRLRAAVLAPARSSGRRRAPGARRGPARLDPLSEQVLELQRTAGNAATARLLDLQRSEGDQAHRTLRWGSTGDDVRELQSALNERSDVATALEVDGIFGPITARAVRELQDANPPLTVDGVVGPKTWAVIDVHAGPADTTTLARKVFDRGAAAYERGDFAHAYDFFVRAYELSGRPGLLFSQGQALRRLGGRREEAIGCYERYLASSDPKRALEATEFIAELRGPAATGVEEVDTAVARQEFERGAAMYEARDFAHAYDEFTKAWELSHRPGLLFSRAQALRRLGGRDKEAVVLYEQYIATGATSRAAEAAAFIAELRAPIPTGDEAADTAAGKAMFEKGATYYEKGDFGHAYDEFTRAWELTHRAGLLFSRAQALRRLGGRRDEAIALFQQYLASGQPARGEEAQRHIHELQTQGAEPR